MSVLKRLTVLREDAEKEPLPQRKFFHIGQPEVLDDVGECIPMISWVDDNLSRFLVADGPSSTWGKASTRLFPLPNRAVKVEDGLFLISGSGNDHALPHPNGKGSIVMPPGCGRMPAAYCSSASASQVRCWSSIPWSALPCPVSGL